MISVITPTIRPEGLEIVRKALERQTYEDWEWLIGSPFDPKMGRWVKDDFTGGYWSLNRIYNKLIKEAKGDIIVSIQDHTLCIPEGLEKFAFWLYREPNFIISGVGDKYDKVYPELGNKVWTDPRKSLRNDFRACNFNEVEGNYCAMKKSALKYIGGFDEDLDFKGYGMDWFNVFDRMNRGKKFEFFIDETNESFSEVHGRVKDWEENNLIHKGYEVNDVKYL
jgi:hypothetical protein